MDRIGRRPIEKFVSLEDYHDYLEKIEDYSYFFEQKLLFSAINNKYSL